MISTGSEAHYDATLQGSHLVLQRRYVLVHAVELKD